MTIGRYSSAFSGYSQQDSQEFVAFLLDGLHEDLNKIKKKPATEKPELSEDRVSDPEAVRQLANECWELHRKRNDSVILDLFAGMYRSVLVCPDCQKVSVTFDPFMDLTLPLPSDNLWIKDIAVIPLNGKPIIYEVAMDVHSTIRQLKEYIVKRLNMTKNGGADRLHCVEVYNYRFQVDYEDRDIVSLKIQPNDAAVVYELDRPVVGGGEGEDVPFIVPVYNRTTKSVRADARKPPGTSDGGGKFFGIPFFITLTSNEARDEDVIKAKISERYKEMRGELEKKDEMEVELEIETEEQPESNNFSISFVESNRKRLTYPVYLRNSKSLSSRKLPEQLPEQPPSPDSSENSLFNINIIGNTAVTPEPAQSEVSDSDLFADLMPLTEMDQEVIPTYEEATEDVSAPTEQAVVETEPDQTVPDETAPEQTAPEQVEPQAPPPQLLFPNEIAICDWQENLIDNWEPERVPNHEAEEVRIAKESQKKTIIDLSDCLDLFSKTEVLGQDDLWYCSKCQCLRQATKTIDLWRVPDIFTIHLKRFSSFRSFRDKISYVVNFPIEGLDMSDRVADKDNYKEGELLYDLIAVDNHYGGLGGGHYTAYAKNFVDNKWYYYDDSNVRVADPEKAISGAAYLLFYRRRTAGPLGGEQMKTIVEEAREKLNNPPPVPTKQESSLFGGSSGSYGSSNWGHTDNDHYRSRETRSGRVSAMVTTGDRFHGQGRTLGSTNDTTSVAVKPWITPMTPAFGGEGQVGHNFGTKRDEEDYDSSSSGGVRTKNLISISDDEDDEDIDIGDDDNDDEDDEMFDADSASTPEEEDD